MENTIYYFESERLVFLTKEDARKFFLTEGNYHCASEYFSLNDFLNEKGYNCEQIFFWDWREKEDILTDYHEELFKHWVNKELIACDMYE